jgi:predicted SAM-dependent methyltransferase
LNTPTNRLAAAHPRRILILAGIAAGGIVIGGAIGGFVISAAPAKLMAPWKIRNYVKTHAVRKLQLGAGGEDTAGWLNTDIKPGPKEAYLDATKRFPFEDGSLHYIYAEHVIEHLTYSEGLEMFRECHRVLAPGGKVRIATPNLLKLVALFREDKTEEINKYMRLKLAWHQWPVTSTPEAMILNLELRSFGHEFIYEPRTLGESMTAAGFRVVREFPSGQSDDPELTGIESRHGYAEDLARSANDYETMVLQAMK